MEKIYFKKVLILVLCIGMMFLTVNCSYSKAEIKPPDKPGVMKSSYDVIVVGSDPEGIAAAVSASRNGLDVLLVDKRPILGGLMTLGWLNTIDMNYSPEGEILNKGIFLEFFNQVEGDSFDIATAANAFNNLVEQEEKLDVMLNAEKIQPLFISKDDGGVVVTGVELVDHNGNDYLFESRAVIDATQDADMAAACGVPYSMVFEDMGYKDKYVAVTLVFKLSGISWWDWWYSMGKLLADERLNSYHSGINFVSAWGFGDIMSAYESTSERVGIRGLNMGRQNDGTVLVNALHIYGVNPIDERARMEARELAEKELDHIIAFLIDNVPGMEDVELDGVAPELYVRISRLIDAEYELTVDDVLENRDFPDAVAHGSYPIDIQSTDKNFRGTIVGWPKQYAVPFRSLVPLKAENLLVVGRSAGFDSLAQGSARVIPVGMACGQAAGAAVAVAIENDITVRELSRNPELIKELRKRLNKQGMEINPFYYEVPETRHWAYEGLKFVRRYGLAYGGYENDYKLDEDISEERFRNLLSALLKLAGPDNIVVPKLSVEGNELTLDDVAYMFSKCMGMEMTQREAYEYFIQNDLFNSLVLSKTEEQGFISQGAAYMMLKSFITDESGLLSKGDQG